MRYLIGLLAAVVVILAALGAGAILTPSQQTPPPTSTAHDTCTRQYRDQAPLTLGSAAGETPVSPAGWPSGQDLLPVHPATAMTTTEAVGNGTVTVYRLFVDAAVPDVIAYYADKLPPLGWVAQYDSPLKMEERGYGQAWYRWHDPKGQVPWMVELQASIGLGYPDGTTVQFDYNRAVDPDLSLPVYSGAGEEGRDVRVSCTEEPTGPGKLVTRTRTTTFVTGATPEQLTEFYNNEMLLRGWRFWDEASIDFYRGKFGYVDKQAGDISSADGLVFKAVTINEIATVAQDEYTVNVTAKPYGDKQFLVELKLVEKQVSIDFKM